MGPAGHRRSIASWILNKTMAFEVVLCAQHASQRRRRIAISWRLFSFAIFAPVAGSLVRSKWNVLGWIWLPCLILIIAGTWVGAHAAAVLSPTRIGKRSGSFRRVGKEFIATLPESPGENV